MATVYPCSAATITVGGSAIPGIIDASVTLNHEPIDCTEIADAWKNFTAGQRGGSMQGTIYYNQGATAVSSLEGAVAGGLSVAIVFTMHTGPASYTANGYVTSFTPSLAVNDVVRASFAITFYGAVTVG
jgi:hypothetical protein